VAALSEIEKLEARWAENPDGRYFAPLADAYRKAGRVDDAIMVVGQGLTKHPDYLSAHIVLGRCHLEKKDDAAALATFEKVLGLDTENIIALKSLAEIAERQQRPDDARRWLQRLLTVDAMNTEAADDLARLGGPLEGAAAEGDAPAALEEAGSGISFADLAPEPIEPEPVAAEPARPARISVSIMDPSLEKLANQQTLHIPRPSAQAAPTERMPALDIEPTSFQPPPPEAAPAPLPGIEQPEAFEPPAVVRKSEVAPAIDFLGAEAKPVGRVSWSGAPEVGDVDLDKPPAPGGPRLTLGTGGAPVELDLDAMNATGPRRSVTSQTPADLPLIMPEDVTPPAELRRPSMKQVQMVSPEPALLDESGEPMVTETMGDLYLKQGFKDKAADVYQRLLAARPGDTMLRAKLAALSSPQQALSAAAQGTEAVGSWLKRIARSSLGAAAPPPPPAPPPAPEAGPSPMDQAFAAGEPAPAPAPAPAPVDAGAATSSGAPARPATDAFTLDRIFGGKRPSGAATPPNVEAPAGPSSFDEFFGEAKQESARPQEGAAGAPSEEDLSAFTTWLHGLKR
jgi:tetratricopeptide (TPR) repeat protein